MPFTAWRGSSRVDSATGVTGEVVLGDDAGIDAVTWTSGPVDLMEVELHLGAGAWATWPPTRGICRRSARTRCVTWSSPSMPAPASRPACTPTGRWTGRPGWSGWTGPPGSVQDVSQPVRVLVARAFRGSGGAPVAAGPFELRNPEQPALACGPLAGAGRAAAGAGGASPLDRAGVPDGWYAWQVRGVDAFGRLGPWSAEREVEVPRRRPPPPDRCCPLPRPGGPATCPPTTAPAPSRRCRAAGGVDLAGRRRVQAPQVEPGGRVPRAAAPRRPEPAARRRCSACSTWAVRAAWTPTSTWGGAPTPWPANCCASARASFEVTGNGSGSGTWVEVRHLAAPTGGRPQGRSRSGSPRRAGCALTSATPRFDRRYTPSRSAGPCTTLPVGGAWPRRDRDAGRTRCRRRR